MYIKDPKKIEASSMEIIESEMDDHDFDPMEIKVVKRTIHTTGDFDYQNIVSFHLNPIQAGIEAINNKGRIVTDTMMAFSGINKRILEEKQCQINNYINEPEAFAISEKEGITRSMAAMDLAAKKETEIFVIGNAPTALYRIGELIDKGQIQPKLIIGVPVGFVGAAESKAFIREYQIPTITTIGRKGGSNVAAAILNAIIYMSND
jgi:precorrin-8X/cobalt-precorrin-8 methylmutase